MNDAVRTEPVIYSCREIERAWWKKFSVRKPGVDVLTGACLLMVLMHLFIVLSGGVYAHEGIYNRWLGLRAEGLLGGKVWQLVSYSFLHGSWFHLLTNLVMIWLIGGRLMTILDQKKVGLCLLLGSVVGGLFFVGFDLWSGQGAFLVGSSGSAFALFILMACLSPEAKMIPIPVRAKNMAVGLLVGSLILCLAHPGIDLPVFGVIGAWIVEVGLTSVFQVAHGCHLGGGLAGLWLSSRFMGKMISLEDLKRSRIH
ncbi:MAG: rhomboid family intramembrane serine protease [Akkermansiaceae bacterium]